MHSYKGNQNRLLRRASCLTGYATNHRWSCYQCLPYWPITMQRYEGAACTLYATILCSLHASLVSDVKRELCHLNKSHVTVVYTYIYRNMIRKCTLFICLAYQNGNTNHSSYSFGAIDIIKFIMVDAIFKIKDDEQNDD